MYNIILRGLYDTLSRSACLGAWGKLGDRSVSGCFSGFRGWGGGRERRYCGYDIRLHYHNNTTIGK